MTGAEAALVVWVTAYGIGCDAPGPHTKLGNVPVEGITVAADPAVLPLRSIVWIEGVGLRTVQDIGGAVKGHMLDVYLADCARAKRWRSGRRLVHVLYRAEGRH